MTSQRNAWMSTVADSVEGTDDVVDGAKPFNKAAKRPAIGATEKYRKYMNYVKYRKYTHNTCITESTRHTGSTKSECST